MEWSRAWERRPTALKGGAERRRATSVRGRVLGSEAEAQANAGEQRERAELQKHREKVRGRVT